MQWTGWVGQAVADVRTFWRTRTDQQAVLAIFGALLVASGLFHIGVWLVAGMPSLEGPVTWRKPIAFGVSTGLLTWSLAWTVGWLPPSRALARTTWAYVALMSAEIALIDLQQWRGVGSHFNTATPMDNLIFAAMGAFIVAAAAIMAVWTVGLFRGRIPVTPALLAARVGMLFLALGNLLGIFIALWGQLQMEAGLVPSMFGVAGQLKVPHAIALHAVQVLPLVAWLLTMARLPEPSQRRAMWHASVGYGALIAFTMLQAFGGRAPLDVTAWSILMLIAGSVLLARPVVMALAAGPSAPAHAEGGHV